MVISDFNRYDKVIPFYNDLSNARRTLRVFVSVCVCV